MKRFAGVISLLLSLKVAAGFQVKLQPTSRSAMLQPKGRSAKQMGSPDDYMQDMLGEMAILDTNYDFSYNNSPTEKRTTKEMPKLVRTMEEVRQQNKLATDSAPPTSVEEVTVVPWGKDDGISEMAVEWDSLGTNYDYSYNNSPTESRCRETESRRAQYQAQQQAAQEAAKQQAGPLVNPKPRDHWEQWMSLSIGADRGENALTWPKNVGEMETPPEMPTSPALQQAAPATKAAVGKGSGTGTTQSYLSSL